MQIVVKKYKEAVDAVMEGIMASTVPVLQSESTTALLFDHVTHQFYFTFWSLSLYDIRVPVDVYDKEVTKLNSQKQAIDARNDWVRNCFGKNSFLFFVFAKIFNQSYYQNSQLFKFFWFLGHQFFICFFFIAERRKEEQRERENQLDGGEAERGAAEAVGSRDPCDVPTEE